MTISRVWILDSVNFTVRPLQQLPYYEAADASFDFEVCILARDGKKYSTQVRYQTTHGPVSYNISNFVAPLETSGVTDARSADVVVYPNPVDDQVYVNIEGPFKYALMDLKGVNVLTGTSERSIGLASLPAGTYFLRINTQEGVEITRQVHKR